MNASPSIFLNPINVNATMIFELLFHTHNPKFPSCFLVLIEKKINKLIHNNRVINKYNELKEILIIQICFEQYTFYLRTQNREECKLNYENCMRKY